MQRTEVRILLTKQNETNNKGIPAPTYYGINTIVIKLV